MFVDSLESRRLFAAAAPVLAGTELRVFGDTGADTIKVLNSDAATIRVEVNGVVSFFASSAVSSLRVNVTPTVLTTGTTGNDNVDVQVNKLARIFGGVGNDTLKGGGASDIIAGEAGDDTLAGNGGNDNLDGGDGKNALSGGDGNDVMTAGTSADNFDGGLGIFRIHKFSLRAGSNDPASLTPARCPSISSSSPSRRVAGLPTSSS